MERIRSKILLIGGTGTISSAITHFLAAVCPADYDLEGNLIGDKAATVIFDCTKLKRAVPGFQATTRFDEGVRRCINHILTHPELQVEDHQFDQWCDKVIEAQEQAKKTLCL